MDIIVLSYFLGGFEGDNKNPFSCLAVYVNTYTFTKKGMEVLWCLLVLSGHQIHSLNKFGESMSQFLFNQQTQDNKSSSK